MTHFLSMRSVVHDRVSLSLQMALLLLLLLPAQVSGQVLSSTTRAMCYNRNVTSGLMSGYIDCQDTLSAEFISSQQEAFGSDFREGDTATISWTCSSTFQPSPVVVEADGEENSLVDVPQAGLVVCSSQDGFCLPYANDTRTYASTLSGNTTYVSEPDASSYYTATFTQELDTLQEDFYTIIAYCTMYADADIAWGVSVAWNYVEIRATAHLDSVSWPAELTVIVMSSVVGAILVVVFGFTVWHHHHVVMKVSQVVFLEGMIVCAIICCVGTYTLSNPTKLRCMLRPWLNIVPLTMLFALLFAKNWRIIKVTSGAGSMKRVIVKSYTVVVLAGALTTVQVIIQATGQQIIGTTVEQAFGGSDANYVEVCGSEGHHDLFWWLSAGYCAILLMLGALLAFEARDLVSVFNESTFIAASTYCATFAGAILMLAHDPLSHDATAYFLFAAILELIIVTSTIGMLMYPKFFLIWRRVPLSLSVTGQPVGTCTEKSRTSTPRLTLTKVNTGTGTNTSGTGIAPRESFKGKKQPESGVNGHVKQRPKSMHGAPRGRVTPLSPNPSLTRTQSAGNKSTEKLTRTSTSPSNNKEDTTTADNSNSLRHSTSSSARTLRTPTTVTSLDAISPVPPLALGDRSNTAVLADAAAGIAAAQTINENSSSNENTGDLITTTTPRVSIRSSGRSCAVKSSGSLGSSCWSGMLKLAKSIKRRLCSLLGLQSGAKVQVEGNLKGSTATTAPAGHGELWFGLSPSTADLFGVSTTKPVPESEQPAVKRRTTASRPSGNLMMSAFSVAGNELQQENTVNLPRAVANTANDAQNALRQMVRQHFCGLTIPREELLYVLEQQERTAALLRSLLTPVSNSSQLQAVDESDCRQLSSSYESSQRDQSNASSQRDQSNASSTAPATPSIPPSSLPPSVSLSWTISSLPATVSLPPIVYVPP